MEEKQEIVYLPIKDLKPYRNNPRKIPARAVDALCQAIKDVGFKRPLDIRPDGTIINGHTRLKAAKKLGYKELPCIICTEEDEKKIRKWRIEDNKTGEFTSFDAEILEEELADLDFGGEFFNFDFEHDLQKQKAWEKTKAACDLKDRVAIRKAAGSYYHSLFKTGKQGKPLAELKTEENTWMFADTAREHIRNSLGDNLSKGSWCIVTTPRRRHADGFHFATAICEIIAKGMHIPFYANAITCHSKQRINPLFDLEISPKERNVILYDDIVTTGSTLKAARDLLTDSGYTVFSIVSIDNH